MIKKVLLGFLSIMLLSATSISSPIYSPDDQDGSWNWVLTYPNVDYAVLGANMGGTNLILAVDYETGNPMVRRNGETEFTQIGGPAAQFAISGYDQIWALAEDYESVWFNDWKPMEWVQVGGPARKLYAGSQTMLWASNANGDLYRYDWTPFEWSLYLEGFDHFTKRSTVDQVSANFFRTTDQTTWTSYCLGSNDDCKNDPSNNIGLTNLAGPRDAGFDCTYTEFNSLADERYYIWFCDSGEVFLQDQDAHADCITDGMLEILSLGYGWREFASGAQGLVGLNENDFQVYQIIVDSDTCTAQLIQRFGTATAVYGEGELNTICARQINSQDLYCLE